MPNVKGKDLISYHSPNSSICRVLLPNFKTLEHLLPKDYVWERVAIEFVRENLKDLIKDDLLIRMSRNTGDDSIKIEYGEVYFYVVYAGDEEANNTFPVKIYPTEQHFATVDFKHISLKNVVTFFDVELSEKNFIH